MYARVLKAKFLKLEILIGHIKQPIEFYQVMPTVLFDCRAGNLIGYFCLRTSCCLTYGRAFKFRIIYDRIR